MRTRKRPIAEMNVVPYIDVMLVLLVIFMITAPLLTQGVKVDLPNANAKAMVDHEEPPIVVSVDAEGAYYINAGSHPDVSLSERALLSRVTGELQSAQQRGAKRQVYVKGDRHVRYEKVVQAMVLLQQAGAERVGLLTQDESGRT